MWSLNIYKEVDELHVCELCLHFTDIRVECNVLEQIGSWSSTCQVT